MALAWDTTKNPICLTRASAIVNLLFFMASAHAISEWTRCTPLSCTSTRTTGRVESLAVVVVIVVPMTPPIFYAGDGDVTTEMREGITGSKPLNPDATGELISVSILSGHKVPLVMNSIHREVS